MRSIFNRKKMFRKKCLETKTRCIIFFISIINNITIVTFNIIIIMISIIIIYSLILLTFLHKKQQTEKKSLQLCFFISIFF